MNILVISVHPDDETLGCGGTILKHKAAGDSIYWLIFSYASEEAGYSKEFVLSREKQIKEVAKEFGVMKTFNLGFLPTKLHSVELEVLIAEVSKVMNEVKPQIVYNVNRSDIHTDHQVASKVITICTKSFRYPFIKRILMYECISETEMAPPLIENLFLPNVYSDISEYVEKKLEIMSIYKSEIQQTPFPRSLENIRALARYRGSSVGVEYAEAFMLIKEVF